MLRKDVQMSSNCLFATKQNLNRKTKSKGGKTEIGNKATINARARAHAQSFTQENSSNEELTFICA